MNMDMKTKKQEAIRKAYGEQYDILKPFIDDNGWLKWSDECPINPVISDYDYNQALNSHRPKSLAGLETNNGWITIESEEDLPIKLGKYKVVLKDRVPFTWIFETFCDIESSGELWMSRYSHYKKVEEELPPIY